MLDECNATGFVTPLGAFTGFTPVTPEICWNVYTAEQRYKYLCDWLQAITDYVDALGVDIDSLNERLATLETAYNETMPKLDDRVTALEKALETIVTSMLIYDPTKGKYTASIDQSRRMLQILATPSDENLTVKALEDSGRTVAEWGASTMCGEMINSSFKRMAGQYMPYQEVSSDAKNA